ncbi:MAG: VOC family protein [Candidatus Gracilibacteria bacterium]
MKILLTNVFVDDVPKAFKFYTEILGFKEKIYMPEMNLAVVVSPEDPEGTALLLEPNNAPHVETYQKIILEKRIPIIVLGIANVQREYQKLKDLGIVFRQPPKHTEWGIVAIFEDTCGNLIEIHEMNTCEEFIKNFSGDVL